MCNNLRITFAWRDEIGNFNIRLGFWMLSKWLFYGCNINMVYQIRNAGWEMIFFRKHSHAITISINLVIFSKEKGSNLARYEMRDIITLDFYNVSIASYHSAISAFRANTFFIIPWAHPSFMLQRTNSSRFNITRVVQSR